MANSLITICSAYDESYEILASCTIPNHKLYCQTHGYEHKVLKRGKREPTWWKIPVFLDCTTEWAVWFDTDLIVTNPEIKLEKWTNTSADLIISYDVNGLNAGVIFIRKSEWSRCFLSEWWWIGANFNHHPNPEQTALAFLLYKEPKDKWQIYHQSEFNSYDYSFYNYPSPQEGQWEQGDFILHLPAISNEKRIERFNQFLIKQH